MVYDISMHITSRTFNSPRLNCNTNSLLFRLLYMYVSLSDTIYSWPLLMMFKTALPSLSFLLLFQWFIRIRSFIPDSWLDFLLDLKYNKGLPAVTSTSS